MKTLIYIFLHRDVGPLRSVNIYSGQCLVRTWFYMNSCSRGGKEDTCTGIMEAQLALIAALSSAALLGLLVQLFLFRISPWWGSAQARLLLQMLVPYFRHDGQLDNRTSLSAQLVNRRQHEVL